MNNKKLKIGFAKMSLNTYFSQDKSKTEGFNHELTDLFDIFQKNGHECVMLSVSDKYEKYEGTDLDFIFLFNGPTPTTESGRKMMMFKNYSFPIIDFINSNDIPYVYFWTDARYDIRTNPLFKRYPNLILSQEKENYGHLEKLILYGKQKQELKEKDIKLGVLMNETDKKRSQEVLKALNWLDYGELRGNWKTQSKFLKEPIQEKEVSNYLGRVKYSYNLAVNRDWVSQKYYEMILNNVICFYKNYDENSLIIPKYENIRKVKDEIDLEEKIELIEKAKDLYNLIIEKQQGELKEEYFNGEFIYQFIIDKINKL